MPTVTAQQGCASVSWWVPNPATWTVEMVLASLSKDFWWATFNFFALLNTSFDLSLVYFAVSVSEIKDVCVFIETVSVPVTRRSHAVLGANTWQKKIKAGAFVRTAWGAGLFSFLKNLPWIQGSLQTFFCECHRHIRNLQINDIHGNHAYRSSPCSSHTSINSKSGILSFPHCTRAQVARLACVFTYWAVLLAQLQQFPLHLFPLVLYSGRRTSFNLLPLLNRSLDLFPMIYGSLNF